MIITKQSHHIISMCVTWHHWYLQLDNEPNTRDCM